MKKLLSLMLCIVFVCFTFVGCAEDVIGEYLPNYNTNKVTDDQVEKLNFYIITGDGTSEEAKITVPQNINTYLKEKYKINLNIKYYTEAEYENAVSAAINNTNESERPDIVLINSKAMFDSLYADNKLVELNDFYNSRDFKSINTIVDDILLSASSVINSETGSSVYYTVPNNHVIGGYKYVVIDKEMARDVLHFQVSEIESMTTEASLQELVEEIGVYYDLYGSSSGLSKEEYVNSYVQIVDGDYDDKLLLEYDVNSEAEITATSLKKNFVNVNSYPTATKEEAFLSAFAIIKQLDDTGSYTEEQEAILTAHYTKCMKIIFALNTDIQLKNMLQYGYVGTNYKFEKNEKNENTNYITLLKGAEVIYQMNPIHTGNQFISYYCEEIGWNEKVHADALRQNADAKTDIQKMSAEIKNILAIHENILEANSSMVVSLPVYGITYSDVVITWSSDSEYAVIAPDGTLTFVSPEAETTVTLSMSLSIDGAVVGTGNIIVKVLPDAVEE